MKKLNIETNRQRIRLNLRQLLQKSGQILPSHTLNPITEHQQTQEIINHFHSPAGEYEESPTVGRMRRKTSVEVRKQGEIYDMSDCNEIFIYNQFSEMYELREKIGEGCESVVYRAADRKNGHIYAIKVFKKKDQDRIDCIKRQFRILKSIDHCNVIKAHNLYVNPKKGVMHLILDYCDYPNLRFHMEQNRVLPQQEIAQIMGVLLSTVGFLHSQGVCHRDLKPENILYDPWARSIKLIDFEIAKMVKYNHQKLEMLTSTGTLYYKAPQMLDFGIYSQLVDVWAIGVICYEMATGELPFRNLYETEICRQIKHEQPKYEKAGISQSCRDFIKKCMEKDPVRRFTALEALKSPFILKNAAQSSPSHSAMKRKLSEECSRNVLEVQQAKCFDQDCQLANSESLAIDNGIRLVASKLEKIRSAKYYEK